MLGVGCYVLGVMCWVMGVGCFLLRCDLCVNDICASKVRARRILALVGRLINRWVLTVKNGSSGQ